MVGVPLPRSRPIPTPLHNTVKPTTSVPPVCAAGSTSTLNSDGVRLFANGVAVVDDFVDQVTNWEDGTAIHLTEGQLVDLQMDYYEHTGSAVAKLKWTGPSFAGANGLPIATEWLSAAAGVLTPYAHAQSVTLVQNTSEAITLTGSGADPGVLAYAIVTPPGHGTLSGTAPNLTYTPAPNDSGTDSFTFLVDNGTGDSTPAMVSIAIWAGKPESWFWANAVSGNWSGASSWVNASGGTVTPAATGQANYVLNLDQPGSYTTTHDLNNGFLFNQLNLAASVTLVGTNSLSPRGQRARAAADQPEFQQRGDVQRSPRPCGGHHRWRQRRRTGESRRLDQGRPRHREGLRPHRQHLHRWNHHQRWNPELGHDGRWEESPHQLGPVTLNADSTIKATWKMTISGNISGTGGIAKTGDRTLTLSGTNSFTGTNQVMAGTLSCSRAAALGTGTLDIGTGAVVDLDYIGTRTLAALTFAGGSARPPGSYGSTASPAANKNDTWFSGTGTVTAAMQPYESWASDPIRGLTAGVDDGPRDDPDLDGIANLLEFVLGGHPLVRSSAILPTTSSGDGGTWIFEYERSDLSVLPATSQVVEYGSDLLGWTPVTIPLTSAGTVTITPGDPSDHVSVAIPYLGATGFARLKVSE